MSDIDSTYTKLIPISDTAEMLGISIDTVRRWDKQGVLHSTRPNGKDRYFSLEEIEKVKNSQPLSISEAAELLGVSPPTLRRYEEKGLISPERNSIGERVYKREEFEHLLRTHPSKQTELSTSQQQVGVSQTEVSATLVNTLAQAIQKASQAQKRSTDTALEPVEIQSMGLDQGIIPQVKDFILFRLFTGLILGGWGLLFLLRKIDFLFTREASYLEIFPGSTFLFSLAFFIAGLMIVAVSLYRKHYGSLKVPVDIFSISILTVTAYLGFVTQTYGIFIVATSIALMLMLGLMRGKAATFLRRSALEEFICLTFFLVVLKGFVMIFLNDISPLSFLAAYIHPRNPLFMLVWFGGFIPFLVFLLTKKGNESKLDIPYFVMAGILSFVTAMFLALEQSWNLAFFCYSYATFLLFLLWWKRSSMVIEERSYNIIFLAFTWILVSVVLSLFAISNFQENLKNVALNQMQTDADRIATDINAKFEATSPTVIAASIQESVVRALQTKDQKAIQNAALVIYSRIPNLRRVVMYDIEGNVLAAYPKSTIFDGKNLSSREYFQKTKSTLRSYTSSVVDAIDGGTIIVQTEPIFQNNKLLGMVGVATDLAQLSETYMSRLNGEALIAVDDQHRYAIVNNDDLLGQLSGKEESVLGLTYKDSDILEVSSYVNTPRWTLYIEQSAKQILDNMRYLYSVVSLFIVLNAVLSLSAAFTLAKKKI